MKWIVGLLVAAAAGYVGYRYGLVKAAEVAASSSQPLVTPTTGADVNDLIPPTTPSSRYQQTHTYVPEGT